MAYRRISKPSEVLSAGQEVEAQILDLRPDERRMVLSIKALLPYEERQGSHREEVRERGERSRDRRGRGGGGGDTRHHPAPQSGSMTIGERLSALKGLAGTFSEEDKGEARGEHAKTAQTADAEAPAAAQEPLAEAQPEEPIEVAESPPVEADAQQPVEETKEEQ